MPLRMLFDVSSKRRSQLSARDISTGIAITSPTFWLDEQSCTDETIRYVFRSCTAEEMPLLEERIKCLREAGHVLYTV